MTGFAPGDEVYGICDGSFAEYAAARAEQARPQAGEPLLRAGGGRPDLGADRAAGRARPGEGAARARRCWSSARPAASARSPCRSPRRSAPRSPACAAPPRSDLVRALGADHVIDYTARTSPTASTATTSILDIGGNRRLSHLRRALTPRGTLVIVGGETGGRWLGGIDRQLRAHAAVAVREPEAGHVHRVGERRGPASRSASSSRPGKVTPAIDRTYPLERDRRRPSATCKTATPAARSSSPLRSPMSVQEDPLFEGFLHTHEAFHDVLRPKPGRRRLCAASGSGGGGGGRRRGRRQPVEGVDEHAQAAVAVPGRSAGRGGAGRGGRRR